MILAGIDIGTNAVRLLIAETSDITHRELHSARIITRLGQGLDTSGVLSADAQERSLLALERCSASIAGYPVVHVAAVGTSALRKARNTSEFLLAAHRRTGLHIRVISGREESRLTLAAVRRALSQGRWPKQDPLASALVIDIGGGSTELMVTLGGDLVAEDSLDLGAVYLTERFLHSDPPTEEELGLMRRAVRHALDLGEQRLRNDAGIRPASTIFFACTGGTAATLAAMDQGLNRYDPERINGYTIGRRALDGMFRTLSATTLSERRSIVGLERGREDIIVAGAAIAQEIMERWGISSMIVSEWGLREGIVFDLFEKHRRDWHRTVLDMKNDR
jgi:exopolyphosphatase/guanosine-5'-triphosphate,3'-diphosphate pyrophosphatase